MNLQDLRLTIIAVFILISSQAQVGINTDTPDDSSILHIESTDKGVLFPRMTTAQRETISATPEDVADGLTVFDTDLDGYYFWDADSGTEGQWVRLLTTVETRDNYVVVKSEADFPDPESGVITLESNTLYEINGSILLTNQLNLNNAYLTGLDTNEDRLIVAYSAGAGTAPMITGSNGGSIRNLILVGTTGTVSPQPIFDLDTTSNPDDILLVTNTIIAGSASVGSISGLETCLFNVVQYDQNGTGLTFSDIDQLFITNNVWNSSNTGTYQTLTGTFNTVAQVSGVVNADSGETGLNVSSGPTISNKALVNSVLYVGDGTRVNPYPLAQRYEGFNLSNDWDVRSPGLPTETDAVATAGYGFSGSITIPTGNNATNGNNSYSGIQLSYPSGEAMGNFKTVTSTSIDPGNLFRFSNSNGILTYEGSEERIFNLEANISVSGGQSDDIYEFRFYKTPSGGSAEQLNNFGAQRIDSSSDVDGVAFSENVSLANGDTIELRVARVRRDANNTATLRLSAITVNVN